MAKVTTGTGDTGYTSLLGDQRVPKYDARPEALGTIDEANCALGLARALSSDPRVREIVLGMQRDLYVLMAEVATPPEHLAAVDVRVSAAQVSALESVEAALQREFTIPNKFVIPGDSVDGAALDVARTVIRRAERIVVRLLHEKVIQNGEVLRYLNRLSDVVFVLARYVEARSGGSTLATRPRRGQ